MFKSSRIASALFAATGAALLTATPALAEDGNTQRVTEGGIQAANNFDHATCICPVPLTGGQEIAVVPIAPRSRPGGNSGLVHVDGNAVDCLVQHQRAFRHH